MLRRLLELLEGLLAMVLGVVTVAGLVAGYFAAPLDARGEWGP